MKKIKNSSNLQVRNSWKIDSSISNELGYGNYTAHLSIVIYEHIYCHAMVYISEDKILIILVENPDTSTNHHIYTNEDKYTIAFKDITDVVHKNESILNLPKQLIRFKRFEEKRQSTYLYLTGNKG